MNVVAKLSVAVCTALLVGPAQAVDLGQAVEQTLLHNPEVRFKLHEFKAAMEEKGVARAGYFPTVDASYTQGHEHNVLPGVYNGPAQYENFQRHGWSVTLTQNLFDGMQTTYSLHQLDHTMRAKYFDFLDSSQTQALEAVRAYIDVLRYRQLLEVAKANYATHKGIYSQIQQKVGAGVGRRVDLEQAAGRLALAESNLLTESSNLHDVSVRYERVVGVEPPADMADVPSLKAQLPLDRDVLGRATHANPAYLSALENVLAARSEVAVRRGAFSPTLDLHLRQDQGNGINGTTGAYSEKMAEVVFNINLSRGGADRARLGMAAEGLNGALDLRDKACRDMRQTVRIAYNDTAKLDEQLTYLRQHALSTEKARDAYRKQFDIGQRTLLDVLDSENELLEAKRAIANAENDQKLAYLRVLAGDGDLLQALHLKAAEDYTADYAGPSADDLASCNTEYPQTPVVDKNAIIAQPYIPAGNDAPPSITQ
ncbi:TolC family outer membrane protein [Paludibacterium yongneupense]|uniref:TolC family outer membrane protein n=1 Tax=Paludibacterium yongneupense TaxID=400061 RepID=UPI000420A7E7|nr:TolC family outer membrane protein [Paludibacterium yongneupense]